MIIIITKCCFDIFEHLEIRGSKSNEKSIHISKSIDFEGIILFLRKNSNQNNWIKRKKKKNLLKNNEWSNFSWWDFFSLPYIDWKQFDGFSSGLLFVIIFVSVNCVYLHISLILKNDILIEMKLEIQKIEMAWK